MKVKIKNHEINTFDEINGIITETHTDNQKRIDHYNYHSKDIHTRIVFYHFKDILGLTNYKYVGVYTNDRGLVFMGFKIRLNR